MMTGNPYRLATPVAPRCSPDAFTLRAIHVAILLAILAGGIAPRSTRAEPRSLRPLEDRSRSSLAPLSPLRPFDDTQFQRPFVASRPRPDAPATGAVDSTAQDPPKTLRLWIEWGGSQRQWQGWIHAAGGSLSDLQPLGPAADEAGSMYLAEGVAHIQQPRARRYDSLSVLVHGAATDLAIDLHPVDEPDARKRIQIPLTKLADEAWHGVLDDRKTMLIVRRAPGDRLRVTMDRDSLVFDPGELFEFAVTPHRIATRPDTNYTCRVELFSANTKTRLTSDQQSTRADGRGELSVLKPFSIKLPEQEGVYNVVVSFDQTRTTATVASSPSKLQRKVQLIVVGNETEPAGSPAADPTAGGWQLLESFYPRQAIEAKRHRNRVDPFSGALQVGDATKLKPLIGGKYRTINADRESYVELAPGGWHAYPLSIGEVGKPHVLEVEYPTGLRQSLSISIVEPDMHGRVRKPAVDTGIDVAPAAGDQRRKATQRVVFWPRSKTPMVLLANRSYRHNAAFGRIRTLAGPRRLPANGLAAARGQRRLSAYFDSPGFASRFGAVTSADPRTHRQLTDWQTFHDAAGRLIQHLQHAGRNGAMISVARDGGTIYPSAMMTSNPRFDSGILFSNGQDPVRKDVLEMILRMFDRAQLTFIPAVHFSAPLAELERLRRQGIEGIELANDLVNDSGIEEHAENGDAKQVPLYNPLDPRVRDAVRQVVQEIAQRYGHHPSFGGVALQMDPATYTQLPGEDWGTDPATLARFRQACEARAQRDRDSEQPDDTEDLWNAWRCATLAEWYESMSTGIASLKPGAKLYLAIADRGSTESPADLEGETPFIPGAPSWQPSPTTGLDLSRLRDKPHMVVLRTEQVQAADDSTVNHEIANTLNKDRQFVALSRGALFLHEARPLDLTAFNRVSPFGTDRGLLELSSRLSPVGADNRRRFIHGLAIMDANEIMDGGEQSLLGSDPALAQFVDLYRRLPRQQFETVVQRKGSGQPVVLRRLPVGDKTYIYAVNDSAWPVQVEIEFPPGAYAIESLTSRVLAPLVDGETRRSWHLELAPYDAAGATLAAGNVPVLDWRVGVEKRDLVKLGSQLEDLRQRIVARKGPSRPLIQDPDFESGVDTGGEAALETWRPTAEQEVTVQRDSNRPQSGRHSLHLQRVPGEDGSAGSFAGVRGNWFRPPTSGRLAVVASLRTSAPRQLSAARMVIEGRIAGDLVSVHREVGRGDDNDSSLLSEQWAPFVVTVKDLHLAQVEQLRIGFDLSGEGDLWVDNVQCFDVWLDDDEHEELLGAVNVALEEFQKGNFRNCQNFLDSHWGQALRLRMPLHGIRGHHLDAPVVARAEATEPPGASGGRRPDFHVPASKRMIYRLPVIAATEPTNSEVADVVDSPRKSDAAPIRTPLAETAVRERGEKGATVSEAVAPVVAPPAEGSTLESQKASLVERIKRGLRRATAGRTVRREDQAKPAAASRPSILDRFRSKPAADADETIQR